MNQAMLKAAKRLKNSNREAYIAFLATVQAEYDRAVGLVIHADPPTLPTKQGRAQQAFDLLEHLRRCDEVQGT